MRAAATTFLLAALIGCRTPPAALDDGRASIAPGGSADDSMRGRGVEVL
jgi:hypothetical protein